MKVLAIGDIHTKIWIIEAVEKIIDDYDAVIFVGDYADDWNSSPVATIQTWKALKALQDKYISKVGVVTGNHDYIYVNKTPTIASGYNFTTQMLIDLPDNIEIRQWLRFLPVTIIEDGVTYSHAGIYSNWKDTDGLWSDYSPIWARPDNTTYKNIPQVFGHTPSETCWEVQPNVWCIDTFSTYPDDRPIGDHTVLEIIDGITFSKTKLETKNGNNNTTSLKSRLPRKSNNSDRAA